MEESEAFSTAMWTAHFAYITAAMLLFGASLFPFYAGTRGWPPRWARCAPLALASILVAAVAIAACLTIADLTGDIASLASPSEFSGFFLETSFGPVWLARLLLSLLLFIAALRAAVSTSISGDHKNEAVFLILSGGIIVTFAAAGHASASSGQASFAIGTEAMHLLAAGAWLGGLPPLLFFVARAAHEKWEEVLALPMLHWFSFMGQWAVAIILFGGVFTLAALIAAWNIQISDFGTSGYGLTVLAKLTLLAIMLVIATVNRFVLMPSLHKDAGQLALLRNMVLAECILGTLILAAATTLSHTPPPSPMDHRGHQHVHEDGWQRSAEPVRR